MKAIVEPAYKRHAVRTGSDIQYDGPGGKYYVRYQNGSRSRLMRRGPATEFAKHFEAELCYDPDSPFYEGVIMEAFTIVARILLWLIVGLVVFCLLVAI